MKAVIISGPAHGSMMVVRLLLDCLAESGWEVAVCHTVQDRTAQAVLEAQAFFVVVNEDLMSCHARALVYMARGRYVNSAINKAACWLIPVLVEPVSGYPLIGVPTVDCRVNSIENVFRRVLSDLLEQVAGGILPPLQRRSGGIILNLG